MTGLNPGVVRRIHVYLKPAHRRTKNLKAILPMSLKFLIGKTVYRRLNSGCGCLIFSDGHVPDGDGAGCVKAVRASRQNQVAVNLGPLSKMFRKGGAEAVVEDFGDGLVVVYFWQE